MSLPHIRLFLVDDHAMVREGLRALLGRRDGFQVIGEASSVEEALPQIEKHPPNIVLMDVRLPGMNGLEGCRELTRSFPNVKVIILTSYMESNMISTAMESGASGYLLKEIESGQLCENIIQVSRGQVILPDAIARNWIKEMGQSRKTHQLHEQFNQLSPQEKRIAREVSRGLMNKEIADQLRLSEKTVKNHLTHIFSKLDISRRSQLAVYYSRLQSERETN